MIKKIIIKVVVFLLVMTGTIFLVNKLNNLKLDAVSRELEEAKLPIVYCQYEGKQLNMMQGYTQVMSTRLMRDGIVPVNSQYCVELLVEDANEYGVEYSYQLRSIAGDNLVEEGAVTDWQNIYGYKQFSINFRMDMRKNQEYVLVFIITNSAGESARYYTRLVYMDEEYSHEIIDYVMEFHKATFNKEVDEEVGNMVYDQLSVKGSALDDDLSHVNLNASYDMVTWGGMEPSVMTGIVPTITEIDNKYAVIKLSYVVENTVEQVSHLYNVEEYYCAVYNKDTNSVELLSFDRYIESVFDEKYISKSRNAISAGIANEENVEFRSTEDNRKLAFVREGQLWYYSYDKSSLTNVFSFQQNNYSDIRTLNRDVDINIVDMDEDGNICFIVYGYMSRGKHEGGNGIAMYSFTSKDLKLQELFYIESDEPYDVMKQEVGRFTYYDGSWFYYLLDGAIYMVDMENGTHDTLVSGIPSEEFLVSDNRMVVAYPNMPAAEDVTQLIVHNFETGEEYVCSGKDIDRFLGLGFVGNDLIYGVARKNDIIISADKEAILPLYRLYIMQPDGSLIKDYDPGNTYIMNAKVEGDKIYLERSNKMNNFFLETQPDYISYKRGESEERVYLSKNLHSAEYNQQDMVFPSNIYISEKVEYGITKNKDNDKLLEFRVKTAGAEDVFYVFNNNGYKGEFKSAGSAIVDVTEGDSGLVVDSEGNTIYRDIAAESYNTVADDIDETPCQNINESLMTCAYMCIEYINNRVEYSQVIACESWEVAFREYTDGVGINISGISLDIAIYFLDRDIPFAACIDDGRYVLVISYNSTHIRYYDPILDTEVKVTRDEFEESMSMQSNTMYTYSAQ